MNHQTKQYLNWMAKNLLPLVAFMLILAILALLALTQVSAMTIPGEMTETAIVGQTKIVKINFTNNVYNFKILNITLENPPDYISFDRISELKQNETKEGNIIVTTTETFSSRDIPLKFIYYYITNTTLVPQEYSIDITSTTFSPPNINLIQGDSIRWTNVDTLIHTIIDQGGIPEFNQTISPNSTYIHTFNTIKNYTYTDIYGGYVGQIFVYTNIQPTLTHNSDHDRSLTLHLSSAYEQTQVELLLLTQNFTIKYNETAEGVLGIKNIGNDTGYNLSLLCDWISFDKQNITLQPGIISYNTFTINPFISSSDQTNKTYSKVLHLTGSNIAEITEEIHITIPYTEIVYGEGGGDINYLIYLKEVYCVAYPTSFLCKQEPEKYYINETIYASPNTTISGDQVQNIQTAVSKTASDMDTLAKIIKDNTLKILGIENTTAKSYNLSQDTKERQKEIESSVTIAVVLIMIIVIVVGGFFLYKYLVKKRAEKEKESYG